MVDAEILAPMDSEDYWSLRNRLVRTHVVRTVGGTLFAVPIAPGTPSLGGRRTRIDLNKEPLVGCHLFRESLVRSLSAKGRKLVSSRPVEVDSMAKSDRLVVPAHLLRTQHQQKIWETVDCRIAYSFDARVFRPPDAKGTYSQVPVVVLAVTVRQRIISSFQQLLALGLPLDGLYAFCLEPARDTRLAPELRLAGRVDKISGDKVCLTSSDGEIQLPTQSLYLEGDHRSFRRLFRCAYPANWKKVEDEFRALVASAGEGAAWLGRVDSALRNLRKDPLELVPGTVCTVGDLIQPESWPSGANTSLIAHPPSYVFDQTGRKLESSSSKGIRDYGPYSRLAPISKVPRVCLVCQAGEQGVSEQFMHKFLNGIPGSVYGKGFLRTYGLDSCQPVPFAATDGTAQAYKIAAERALREGEERAQQSGGLRSAWDFAFVQVEERTHQLRGDENPYLVTKAFFLTHQIPVQEFRIETARTPDSSLAWTLGNVGLATYAKMGGIPWLLQGDPTTTHELVLGSASSAIRDDRLGKAERVVGITSIFSGDGTYYLHTISKAVPMEEYSDALIESLRSAISKVRIERNWCKGDRVRIIFHAFKPMRNSEADAIMKVAGELNEFDVEFAFIHVAGDGSIQLFDREESGLPCGSGDSLKGRAVPSRGWMISLSELDLLVTTTGGKELKRPSDGAPVPLMLHLHPASTFRDLRYLGQQVFHFASHSWRGFQPTSMPVTIYYSQLIARLMGKLARTSRWNPDSLCGRIGTTRWFL